MNYQYNILFLSKNLMGGGAESMLVNTAMMLTAHGCQCHILLLNEHIDFTVKNDILIHYAKLANKLRFKPIHQICLASRIIQLDKKIGGFDLILSNYATTGKSFLPNHLKHKFYYWLHLDYTTEFNRTKKTSAGQLKKFIQGLHKRFSEKQVISVSNGAKKALLNQIQCKPDFIQTIYNPFNLESIRALSIQTVPNIPKQPFILHAARFSHDKRFDLLFTAFSKLKSNHMLVLLTKQNNELDYLISNHNLSNRVVITGFQQNPYPWFKAADLSILCSDHESFGNVIIESLICGTPVVSTDCPSGPREILTGELSNWLVPTDNADALADKIEEALSTDIQIDDKYLERFSSTAIIPQYLALIERSRHKTNA
ncbi:glycosyltransferase [Piscirickettsia salmonis]|uniref:glycosyltransferase n=1 Tax=Piscirickettsia salmonis TaxID=1238 RepID=UPI0007C8872E|nr:Glycosyltransferase [Piscirickettsiaceae bacterium NZ-RLO1]